MAHWELYKKLKLDPRNTWRMLNPVSIQVNETYNVLLDFQVQIDRLILAWRQDLVIDKKKKKKKKKKKEPTKQWTWPF